MYVCAAGLDTGNRRQCIGLFSLGSVKNEFPGPSTALAKTIDALTTNPTLKLHWDRHEHHALLFQVGKGSGSEETCWVQVSVGVPCWTRRPLPVRPAPVAGPRAGPRRSLPVQTLPQPLHPRRPLPRHRVLAGRLTRCTSAAADSSCRTEGSQGESLLLRP